MTGPAGIRPVLVRWRGRDVPSYPAMLYVGTVVGLAVGNVIAKASGLPSGRVYIASVVLVVPALIGARLASVLGDRDAFRGAPGAIWQRTRGGQAMYGGLVAVPLSVPLLAALGVGFWPFWDTATFTILTGMVFARVGCLLTGCCAGRPTEHRLGIVLPDHRGIWTRRVPTQLLEGALGAGLLTSAAWLATAHPPAGSVFLSSLALYAVGRLLLQPLRDRQTRVAGVPALRATSIALLLLSLVPIVSRVT